MFIVLYRTKKSIKKPLKMAFFNVFFIFFINNI